MTRHVPRLYCGQHLEEGQTITLADEASHHLLRVLRLTTGDAVTLFDGQGGEHPSAVTAIDRKRVVVRVGANLPVARESALRVVLAQGISRTERMDYTIQKAVELGVAAIQPLETVRSIVRLDAERRARKQEHWQAVARSAAEQCGRDRVPAVAAIMPLENWLGSGGAVGIRLLLDPAAAHGLRGIRLPSADDTVILLIGPEGGLDETEISLARNSGFAGIRLGPRILRTETAGMAALAALQASWGDLCG